MAPLVMQFAILQQSPPPQALQQNEEGPWHDHPHPRTQELLRPVAKLSPRSEFQQSIAMSSCQDHTPKCKKFCATLMQPPVSCTCTPQRCQYRQVELSYVGLKLRQKASFLVFTFKTCSKRTFVLSMADRLFYDTAAVCAPQVFFIE